MKLDKTAEANITTALIEFENAVKKLFKTISPEIKKSGNVMDRVKTIEDACREVGEDMEEIADRYPSDVINFKYACIICRALNEEWVPDWENTSQYKWFPWFQMRGGFGFSFSYYTYTNTAANVGSRLCFKSEELSNYAGKQFESIYKNLLTIQP
jgi:hypothetical protein